MRLAVCHFSLTRLRYACFAGQDPRPVCQGHIVLDHEADDPAGDVITRLLAACSNHDRDPLDALAIHTAYGGEAIDAPALLVDDAVIARLDAVVGQAPLLIPFLRVLLQRSLEILHGRPLVLCCDTGFFVHLPEAESVYAIGAADGVPLRKFGFHGLYHHAAVQAATGATTGDARVITCCLADHPELAAVRHGRPLMVTGGISPVDGLPGIRQCGDLDPGIPLILAQRHGMDASRIDRLLQRESGLLALCDIPRDTSTFFRSLVADDSLALRVFRHRLTLATGAAVAVLGGLDVWVNAGPHAEAAEALVRPVLDALPPSLRPRVLTLTTGLDAIIVAHARACLLASPPTGGGGRP